MKLDKKFFQNKKRINYFDFGLYNAIELRWMKTILPLFTKNYCLYGFEACKFHFDKISHLADDKTNLFNLAISNSDEEFVNLYHANNRIGHSVYSSKNNVSDKFEVVKAVRFSKWLINQKISLDNSFNIVKINIEGAEWDFFNDLVENDLHKKIDVLYMSYDNDVEKIREFKQNGVGEKFSKLLKDNNISPILY